MLKKSTVGNKMVYGLMSSALLSLCVLSAPANARDGCKLGFHPNPDNPKQCVANGTTGLETKCDPGQKQWYNPRTKNWYPCH